MPSNTLNEFPDDSPGPKTRSTEASALLFEQSIFPPSEQISLWLLGILFIVGTFSEPGTKYSGLSTKCLLSWLKRFDWSMRVRASLASWPATLLSKLKYGNMLLTGLILCCSSSDSPSLLDVTPLFGQHSWSAKY